MRIVFQGFCNLNRKYVAEKIIIAKYFLSLHVLLVQQNLQILIGSNVNGYSKLHNVQVNTSSKFQKDISKYT